MAEGMGVDFAVLLTLAEAGRSHLEEAANSLEQLRGVVAELGGEVHASIMTHGHYDAVVAGHAPSLECVSSLAGWIAVQGYFTSQSLIGAASDAFRSVGRPYVTS